eukprot:gene15474-36988_t
MWRGRIRETVAAVLGIAAALVTVLSIVSGSVVARVRAGGFRSVDAARSAVGRLTKRCAEPTDAVHRQLKGKVSSCTV